MVTKNDVINDVLAEMRYILKPAELERLQVVMVVKLSGYELMASETLPSIEVRDNDWILKRYTVDLIAKGREESTIKQYLLAVKNFLTSTGLTYNVVTAQDVTDYLAVMQFKKKISQSYKRTLQSYIVAFFTWAYKKHHIENDVVREIDRVKQVKKPKDRLTDEEVARCKAMTTTPRDKALLELMLSTGMRVGEIETLNIEDIDFKNDTVRIWGEKTNTERTGFLTPDCKIALMRYIGNRAAGPVFVSERKKTRIKRNKLEEIAKRMAKNADSHCVATVHVYRKTFASVMYRKTGDVLLVSKLLGHAGTDITIKYYLIDDIEDMRYKMRKIA